MKVEIESLKPYVTRDPSQTYYGFLLSFNFSTGTSYGAGCVVNLCKT